jgi:DNA-binding CsgD family transcriptional regulator
MTGTRAQRCCTHAHLNDRQVEVALLIARGMADREVARVVGLSPYTVRYYVTTAMQEVGARSRAHLVAICYATGVLVPGVWPPTATDERCLRLSAAGTSKSL